MIGQDRRGDWTIKVGRFRATLPATGPEVDAWVDAGKPPAVEVGQAPERVSKLAAKVVSRTRHKPTGLKAYDYKNGSGQWRHRFVPLDGEESVSVRVIAQRHPYYSADNYPTEWGVFCDSPRCRAQPKTATGFITALRDAHEARDLVEVIKREGYLDAGMVSRQITETAEQAAYDARNAHIEWHRAQFGVSGRVVLDRWIYANAMVAAPEPDRAELDRQLAIAKAEREVMISKKIGTRVKLKRSVGSYATTGVIREVYGEGESALFEVDTVDQTGYRKTEHLVRNQFTLAGAS